MGKSAHSKRPAKPPLCCPECGSTRVWKDGFRYTRQRDVQRFLCKLCGFRFSQTLANIQVKVNISGQLLEQSNSGKNLLQSNVFQSDFPVKPTLEDSPFKSCEHVTSHTSSKQTITEKVLNTFADYNRERQVCAALTRGAKNLIKVETRQEKPMREGTKLSKPDIKGKIIEYIWRLKNDGYADSTVENYARILRILYERGADLWSPESVKHKIRQQSWSTGRKMISVHAYSNFIKLLGLSWNPPKYKPPEKLPFIPQEREIDDLIAGCSYKIATFLQLLKETGMRAGEGFNTKWIDLDTIQNTVRVTPEKNSRPRIFKISNHLIAMLNRLPRDGERLFNYASKASLRRTFEKQRKRIAHKLSNPRIQRISFHTLRHWKATMEYHRTKDILHVMQLLGHKNIKNTLKYTQLVNFEDDDYACKVAREPEEIKALIELGFDYITEQAGLKFFRKRK